VASGLEPLVQAFIRDGVAFVAVVGGDASLIEDIIDEVCVGDGTRPYGMLTSSHPGDSLAMVVEFAKSLSLGYAGSVEVVEFKSDAVKLPFATGRIGSATCLWAPMAVSVGQHAAKSRRWSQRNNRLEADIHGLR
jgi:hypothetical protein